MDAKAISYTLTKLNMKVRIINLQFSQKNRLSSGQKMSSEMKSHLNFQHIKFIFAILYITYIKRLKFTKFLCEEQKKNDLHIFWGILWFLKILETKLRTD